MKLGGAARQVLVKIITGDAVAEGEAIAPYRSGPRLVDFFNELGFDDTYAWGGGFPTRAIYCDGKVQQLNDEGRLRELVVLAFEPEHFDETEFNLGAAVEHFNKKARRGGIAVTIRGDHVGVHRPGGDPIELNSVLDRLSPLNREFAQRQISKCEARLAQHDYEGVVTSARSMLEAVLLELEAKL